ncbi:MAG: R3H domain protein [Candidatus Diapherotrites archaeon ADurb.Bin253]|jgi:spoIIIJ-associated protein|nr:MAG: R3H domain protein [Candidatus Diapherotrites archaeon ADurb.Bin253]HQA98705.1 R3H domain-containing nucleic acid-binding protein [Candidatus Dojkabacteria bacterium]
MKDKEILKLVDEEIEKLSSLLNIESERFVEIEDGEENMKYIKVRFEGEDLGYMIGNRGRHLDSLQFILQVILGRKLAEDVNFRVFVDVGGYRKEKDDKLEQMALEKADNARILGEPIELPPMKPSDRRIIHLALMKFKDISTESVGEGMDRHIVITPIK